MYKGKKNKALVAIARDEWKLTAASKKASSKGLWIRPLDIDGAGGEGEGVAGDWQRLLVVRGEDLPSDANRVMTNGLF